DELHADDLVDDAGKLAPGLGALHLECPFNVVEIVNYFFKDADEDDVLGARVLQLMQPVDHLARVQTVSRAQVLSAATRYAIGVIFRIAKRKSANSGNRINKDRLILIEVFELAADNLIMLRTITGGSRKAWIGAADAACEVARRGPVVDPDSIDR